MMRQRLMEDERLFAAVVEAGGFSAAARVVGTTQARVSRAVARLEQRLGVVLLRRSSRRVEPTAAGRSYAEGLRRILRDVGALEARLVDPGGMSGPLRVTAPPALTRRLLADGFARFCRDHPNVRLELELNARRANLLDDGFDLAVRLGPLRETWRRATLLLRGSYHVFAAPRWADTVLTEEGLSKVPCLVLRTTHLRDRWPILDDAGLRWVQVTPTHLLDDIDLMIQLAGAGLGLVVLPDFLVPDEVAQGTLVQLNTQGPPAEVYALTEAHQVPLARALVPYLQVRPSIS